jgi:iron complex transport system permease protein
VNRWSASRALTNIAGSAALWAVVGGACLFVGSTGGIGLHTSVQFSERLNVVLIASLVGAALASSGVAYQSVLRNPLADPYLLGVSSGAALFTYIWQFDFATPFLTRFGSEGGAALSQEACAFVGALLAVSIVFVLASRRGRVEPLSLLLVGVIVNAVNGSIYLLVNAIMRGRALGGNEIAALVGVIHTNLMMQDKLVAVAVIGVAWLVLMYLSGQLNVAVLSAAEAEALGVRIHRLRWVAMIVASLATASAVAISGPIGFIGLVCPHLARLIVGGDVRKLLPLATAMGAALLALADAASRYIAGTSAGTVLPVGVLTGLLGGPFFLLLLWQSRRGGALEGGQ